MELKVVRKGFVIISPTLCQGNIIGCWDEIEEFPNKWKSYPTIFLTEESAYMEIAEDKITELDQFIKGEREFEHTDFSFKDWVEEYTEWDDGTIQIGDNRQITTLEELLKQR